MDIQLEEIQKKVWVWYNLQSDIIEIYINNEWVEYAEINLKEWDALKSDDTIWTLSTTTNQSVTVDTGSKITFVLKPNGTATTKTKVRKGTLSYKITTALSSYVKVQISYDGNSWIDIGNTYNNTSLSYQLTAPAYIRISETYTSGHTVVFTELIVE